MQKHLSSHPQECDEIHDLWRDVRSYNKDKSSKHNYLTVLKQFYRKILIGNIFKFK